MLIMRQKLFCVSLTFPAKGYAAIKQVLILPFLHMLVCIFRLSRTIIIMQLIIYLCA